MLYPVCYNLLQIAPLQPTPMLICSHLTLGMPQAELKAQSGAGPYGKKTLKSHWLSNWNGLRKRNYCAVGQANGWWQQRQPQKGTETSLTHEEPLWFQSIVVSLQGNQANLFNHLQCYHVFVRWKFPLGSMWQNADRRHLVARHQEAGQISGPEMQVPRLTVPIRRERRETGLCSRRLHAGRGGLTGNQVLSEHLWLLNTAVDRTC